MSKLNFASISEAYMLGSDSIKNTNEEIAKLKLLIESSSIKKKNDNKSSKNDNKSNEKCALEEEFNKSNDNKLSKIDNDQCALEDDFNKLSKNDNKLSKNDNKLNDIDIYKILDHPNFESIIQKYLIINQPKWLNNFQTKTTQQQQQQRSFASDYWPRVVVTDSQEYFGAKQFNYNGIIIFLVVSLIMYLLLKEYIS